MYNIQNTRNNMNTWLQNYGQVHKKYGVLTLSNGQQVSCTLEITQRQEQSQNYGFAQRGFQVPTQTTIDVEIIAKLDQTNNQILTSIVGKIDGNFVKEGYIIDFNGLQIINISHTMNQEIEISGILDHYTTEMLTEPENKRIMREKKLKRILKNI